MNLIEDVVFDQEEEIHLDFNTYVRCEFLGATLIYHGYGPVAFHNCVFVQPDFVFSDAAQNVIGLMQAMYDAGGGGQQMVEGTFNNIKQGHYRGGSK